MILYNQSKRVALSRDIKEAKSVFDKVFGLLNKKNPKSLIFKTRFGIHTFFLKEPIDIIVLNNNSQVIKVKTINPYSLFFYNPVHIAVIELPKGTIKKTQTTIGDSLIIK